MTAINLDTRAGCHVDRPTRSRLLDSTAQFKAPFDDAERTPPEQIRHAARMSVGVLQACHYKVFFERHPRIRATGAWRRRSVENVETR